MSAEPRHGDLVEGTLEPQESVSEIHDAEPSHECQFQIEPEVDAEIAEVDLISVLAQTSAVSLYRASCSTGVGTSFRIPVLAWNWHTRLGFYRGNGARISLSPIHNWNRSYYPGSRPGLWFGGRLPSGTRTIRAFWWHDGSATWWNDAPISC